VVSLKLNYVKQEAELLQRNDVRYQQKDYRKLTFRVQRQL